MSHGILDFRMRKFIDLDTATITRDQVALLAGRSSVGRSEGLGAAFYIYGESGNEQIRGRI